MFPLQLPQAKIILIRVIQSVAYTESTPWDDVAHFLDDQNASHSNNNVRERTDGDDGSSDSLDLCFGLILELNVQQGNGNGAAVKKAALVTNLSRRYMSLNEDSSREFRDLAVQENGRDEQVEDPLEILMVSGHLVASLEVEEITPEEWSIIKPVLGSSGPDDAIVLRPKSGRMSKNWIVRRNEERRRGRSNLDVLEPPSVLQPTPQAKLLLITTC